MKELEAIFPRLKGPVFQVTSPPSQSYNCIAWAAGDDARWWWPDAGGLRYWPPSAPRIETLAAFIEAFRTLDFECCQDGLLETGFEKIALFADYTGPQHASRQLPNGRWTSKLGELQDIEHVLHDLEGSDYGSVSVFMKRPIGIAPVLYALRLTLGVESVK